LKLSRLSAEWTDCGKLCFFWWYSNN